MTRTHQPQATGDQVDVRLAEGEPAFWLCRWLLRVRRCCSSTRRRGTRGPRWGSAADDERAVADLTVRVEREWAEEAVLRDVTRPAPLMVRWSSTGRAAGGRQVVVDDAGPDWRELPLRGVPPTANPG